MGTHNYSGSQKAAILLLSFGEEISSEIFKNLNEFEIKRIGTAMSRLGRLEEDIVDDVIAEAFREDDIHSKALAAAQKICYLLQSG